MASRSLVEMGQQLRRDLSVALRSLRRSPTFTIATIVILALGIGMSAAMFTIYKGLLIDRFPIADQERVVVMHPLDRGGANLDAPYPYLETIRRDSAVFRSVAGVYHLGASPWPYLRDGTPLNLTTTSVTSNFFSTLGMRPLVGRLVQDGDEAVGATSSIVLSYQAWMRRFGGDAVIAGKTLTDPYSGKPVRIVGVAPPGFTYPAGTEAWRVIPADFTAQVDIVARIATNVTPDAASKALYALMQRSNPFASNVNPAGRALPIAGVNMKTFAETVVGGARATVLAVTLAVALLLVIACTNVGGLVLVRLAARQREVAVRRAIGAAFGDVVRLFVLENVVLGAIGGVLGLVVAVVLLRSMTSIAPLSLTRLDILQGLGAPVALTTVVALLTMLLFGIAPSVVAAHVESYAVLRADTRTGSDGAARRRTRRILVAAQLALAVVLIAGAALLVRTLARLESMDLGYDPEHISLLSFIGPLTTFSSAQRNMELAHRLLDRIEALPGVAAATPIESEPFKGMSSFIMKLTAAEHPSAEDERQPFVPWEFVGPNYFQTFRIPILRGRSLATTDVRGAARVVVVNETLARRLWPNEDAIGKHLRVVYDTAGVWTVVGVAQDTHFRELREVGPVIYFNWDQQQPFWNGYIAVRSSQPLASMLPAFQRATKEVDPTITIWDTSTMDDLLARPLTQPRLSALLLSAFSLVALLVSANGLYGLMATAVRQQTRDIGVRVALGATPRDVRRLILGEAMWVVGVGAAAGLVIAAGTSRLLASQLFGVSPGDPRSLIGACLLLVLTGAAAAYLPARRAARIDPVDALRSE
jgi:putative ABC transport system permease protein